MKATVTIHPPNMPNYLRTSGLSPDSAMVPVEALTDEEVEIFITGYGAAFRAHVAERRRVAQEATHHG